MAELLGVVPQTKRSQVQFLVRAHAQVLGLVPSRAHEGGNRLMFLSHISVSLPPFLLSLLSGISKKGEKSPLNLKKQEIHRDSLSSPSCMFSVLLYSRHS